MTAFDLPAQPIDATQALNLSAGVWNRATLSRQDWGQREEQLWGGNEVGIHAPGVLLSGVNLLRGEMTIGTGIFLSALVIAAAILFALTRGQWNWKKIALWTFGLLVIVPAVIVGGISGYDAWEKRPRVQEELWNIRPGDTEADVRFKRGNPTGFTDSKRDRFIWTYALADNGSTMATVKTGETTSQLYFVSFTAAHRVKSVICVFGELPSFPTLGYLGSYSSLEDIEAKLGEPSFVSRLQDETERMYSFDKYHVAFAFSRGKMTEAAVYDPAEGPVRFATEAK